MGRAASLRLNEFDVLKAAYSPPDQGAAPDWSRSLIGVRCQWFVCPQPDPDGSGAFWAAALYPLAPGGSHGSCTQSVALSELQQVQVVGRAWWVDDAY